MSCRANPRVDYGVTRLKTVAIHGALFIVALVVCGIAAAQRQPTDAELRSAYCIPILDYQIGLTRPALQQMEFTFRQDASYFRKPPTVAERAEWGRVIDDMKRDLKTREDAVARLRSYLLPRISEIDVVGLALAKKRGDTDVTTLEQLTRSCPCNGSPDMEACITECRRGAPDGFMQRWESCANPSWLPF